MYKIKLSRYLRDFLFEVKEVSLLSLKHHVPYLISQAKKL